jgi:hypothetical protein
MVTAEFSGSNLHSKRDNFPVLIIDILSTVNEYWWESQKEIDHWEDQDVGGWTILKWMLREIR